ncbi:hypothetical protein ACE6H2_002173 [Prunus campanulata]
MRKEPPRGEELGIVAPHCYCGRLAWLQTSWAESNPLRRFFVCPKSELVKAEMNLVLEIGRLVQTKQLEMLVQTEKLVQIEMLERLVQTKQLETLVQTEKLERLVQIEMLERLVQTEKLQRLIQTEMLKMVELVGEMVVQLG